MRIYTLMQKFIRLYFKKLEEKMVEEVVEFKKEKIITMYDKIQNLKTMAAYISQSRPKEAAEYLERLNNLDNMYLCEKASYNASLNPSKMAIAINPETDRNLARMCSILEREITTFKDNVVIYEVANKRLDIFIDKLDEIVIALLKNKNANIVDILINKAKEKFNEITNLDIESIKSYSLQKGILEKVNKSQYLMIKIQVMYYKTGDIESYITNNISKDTIAIELLKDLDKMIESISSIVSDDMKEKIQIDIRRFKQFNYLPSASVAITNKTYWLDILYTQQLIFDILKKEKKEKAKKEKIQNSIESLNNLVSNIIISDKEELLVKQETLNALESITLDLSVVLIKTVISKAEKLEVLDVYKFVYLLGKREDFLNIEEKSIFLDEFFKVHMNYLSKGKLTEEDLEIFKKSVKKDSKKEYVKLCIFNKEMLEELKSKNLDVVLSEGNIFINKRLVESITSIYEILK